MHNQCTLAKSILKFNEPYHRDEYSGCDALSWLEYDLTGNWIVLVSQICDTRDWIQDNGYTTAKQKLKIGCWCMINS